MERATGGGGEFVLGVRQHEQDLGFELRTEGLVLATGYSAGVPAFLDGVRDRYSVDAAGTGEVFVQNAELSTHGFVTPDLGMAAHRNSWIIRAMTGREVYPIERRIAFQEFAAPQEGE